MPEAIGRYRIVRQLGRGGMGVVYEARDDRLNRTVALKLMHDAMTGADAVERFWREARAAAALNHPHVCQIYELGEDSGRPFIVMERLLGESLADRLARGSLVAREAAQIALGLLDALDALHQQQVVHRDLKPTNVFLTPHGVKLLDFGLARSLGGLTEATAALTNPGVVIGTPHYMSPEHVGGGEVDARSDIFGAGAMLFEMLSGQVAFGGATPLDVLQKVLHEQPPALVGSPLVTALDAVIHRALAKKPDARYPTAAEMAGDVRNALLLDDSGEMARVTAMTRLVVLPFRVLRPDPDTEFLAFSLPDAITSTLSGHEAISVRSPLAAARYAAEGPNLKTLAAELDVDHVLTGSLLRSGDQLRITVQLVQAPGGRVMWSHVAQTALGDLLVLQDTLCAGICDALPLAQAARPWGLGDGRRSSPGYEKYLRANQLALEPGTYRLAASMYERCLEEDPGFAPAWARLGRIRRVIGKYLEPTSGPMYDAAEEAFRRALALDPELPITHSLYSYLEVELGRADQAMVRLLGRLRRQPGNAELFAALVHACRYAGLLEASIAAHERARRLDPQVRTSVLHTYFMRAEYGRCLDESEWLTDPMIGMALIALGRLDEAVDALRIEEERFSGNNIEKYFVSHLRVFITGDRTNAGEFVEALRTRGFPDGEGVFYAVRTLAYLGETRQALDAFKQVIERGFYCYPAFARDPWLDSLRTLPEFVDLMRMAEARHREAAQTFADAHGPQLLGLRA